AGQRETRSRRPAAEVRLDAEGNDPLSVVSRPRLADRQRPHGIPVQTLHETAQRLWPPLGSAQRDRRCGPGYAGQKRPVATILAKPLPRRGLRPPRSLVTPLTPWRRGKASGIIE